MPSTHTSLHYHIVFSTKNRDRMIATEWKDDLFRYLGGVVKGLDGVPLQIGGTADHVHLLLGLRATHCIADVVRDIKSASSKWAGEQGRRNRFAWQEGYGAFTVSRSNIDEVRHYVATQEEHHAEVSYETEYRTLLDRHEVEYDERFLW